MTTNEKISVVAQLILFAGFIIGAIKFAKEKKREFQRRFFEEQLKIFSEVLDNSAILLAYEKTDDEYKLATKNFKRLFWGKMCLVEDKDVEAKMCKFDLLLDNYNTQDDFNEARKIKSDLHEAQLSLSHTCRNSCLRTWRIENGVEGYNDYSLNKN